MSKFLERALRLHERGYVVLPVRPTLKRVVIEGWPTLETTESDIHEWAKSGYKNGNIGINTRFTPAVDIDVYDADAAREMEEWITDHVGETCVRVGRAPKRLMVFRTDDPFRKMSATYTDGQTEHKIEVLGAGQQFVAYGIHPDTKKPYTWTSLDEPLDTPRSALPELTLDTAHDILDKFCLMCEARGWELVSRSDGSPATRESDDLENYKPIVPVSVDTVRETLDVIPNDDVDYDEYLTVGMALHHQFDGSDEGLQLWHEWAEKSAKYDAADLNRRYSSFGDGPATVTFRSLMRKAQMVRKEAADKAFEKNLNRVMTCNAKTKLLEEILPALAKVVTNDIQGDIAVKKVQERLGELEGGAKPRLESVRKMFNAAMPKKTERDDVPGWCENWVYVQSGNNFYHVVTGVQMSRAAFDASFGRYLITDENRAKGEMYAGKASDAALNLYLVPIVNDYLYFPGADDFLELEGNKVVNTWNRNKIPLSKKPKSRDEHEAIEIFMRHMETLFLDPRERRLMLDYLAYQVQYPSERVHWAPIVQGVDGGGKSYFQPLMAAVLGSGNVGIATVGDIHEQYTAWAEGKKMVFFEEIRVRGDEKYEVVNKVKAYITNPSVNIRRMNRNSYTIPNMTNYFLFTNYLDAVPMDRTDRRYFVVRTAFLTEKHIRRFRENNPGYFNELFESLAAHAPVLRWFLEQHELSDEFDPRGHAPRTEAWELMFEEANNVGEGEDEIDMLIRNKVSPYITEDVLLASALKEHSGTYGSMNTRRFGDALAKAGFQLIASVRLEGRDGPKERVYSRDSEIFTRRDKPVAEIVRELTTPKDEGDGFD